MRQTNRNGVVMPSSPPSGTSFRECPRTRSTVTVANAIVVDESHRYAWYVDHLERTDDVCLYACFDIFQFAQRNVSVVSNDTFVYRFCKKIETLRHGGGQHGEAPIVNDPSIPFDQKLGESFVRLKDCISDPHDITCCFRFGKESSVSTFFYVSKSPVVAGNVRAYVAHRVIANKSVLQLMDDAGRFDSVRAIIETIEKPHDVTDDSGTQNNGELRYLDEVVRTVVESPLLSMERIHHRAVLERASWELQISRENMRVMAQKMLEKDTMLKRANEKIVDLLNRETKNMNQIIELQNMFAWYNERYFASPEYIHQLTEQAKSAYELYLDTSKKLNVLTEEYADYRNKHPTVVRAYSNTSTVPVAPHRGENDNTFTLVTPSSYPNVAFRTPSPPFPTRHGVKSESFVPVETFQEQPSFFEHHFCHPQQQYDNQDTFMTFDDDNNVMESQSSNALHYNDVHAF